MNGWKGRKEGIEPLAGIPSTSSLARASAVWASLGRAVRIREAERGRGRVGGVGESGIGAGVGAEAGLDGDGDGEGGGDIVVVGFAGGLRVGEGRGGLCWKVSYGFRGNVRIRHRYREVQDRFIWGGRS